MFVRRDGCDLVEGAPAHTEGEAGMTDEREAQHADAIDRSSSLWPVIDQIEGEAAVDELLGHVVVETARTNEADDVPVAGELDGVARHEKDAYRRSSGGDQAAGLAQPSR